MITKVGILETAKSNGKGPSSFGEDKFAGVKEPDTAHLGRLIAAYAPHDGSFELRVPGLHANRFSRANKECVHVLRLPSLCIAAQGAKTVIVGDEVYEYNPSRMIVFSVALPVAAQVTQASHSSPYLSLKLDLDPHKIAELVLKVYPHGLPPAQERSAVYVTPVDASMINAATRLMECLGQPGDAELLAPLVIDEILIRLLRSPIGVRVAQMGFAESSVHRVAKAISWLRENFSQPMKVEELAGLVHMSVSSFHEHFKSVTSMSPLHYQKVLRLQEARRLMLSTVMDAGAASQRVGYLALLSSAENTAASSGVRRARTSPDCVKRLECGPDRGYQRQQAIALTDRPSQRFRPYSMPSCLWICSSDAPFVSGTMVMTQRS